MFLVDYDCDHIISGLEEPSETCFSDIWGTMRVSKWKKKKTVRKKVAGGLISVNVLI